VHLAVHPDHLRQGHGRHLLASLGSKLAILGPPRMIAEVPETLAAACALFAAAGYVEEARLTDYVWDGGGRSSPAAEFPHFIIPVTVDDLAANGLLEEGDPHVCWERSVETLRARKDEITGLAVASDEGLEACLLYRRPDESPDAGGEVVLLRSLIEDGGARLLHLLDRFRSAGALRIPKVHPAEISPQLLAALGFRSTGVHRLYAAKARSE